MPYTIILLNLIMLDLKHGLEKVKKVVLEEVAGIVTTPRVKELASAVTGKKARENLNAYPKPELPH